MILWLCAAVAAPRVVTGETLTDGALPKVFLVDDAKLELLRSRMVPDATLHASWQAAAASASHPVLYPADALLDGLIRQVNARVLALVSAPERAAFFEQALQNAAGGEQDALEAWLAVGVSLGGTPLDHLALPPKVVERASFDAAAFRAENPLLGAWHTASGTGPALRQAWLARAPTSIRVQFEALIATEEQQAAWSQMLAADQEVLGGDGTWLMKPLPYRARSLEASGGLHAAIQGLEQRLRRDRDSTRAVPAVVPPLDKVVVRPLLTVEPTGFWEQCATMAGVEVSPVTTLCRVAARQAAADAGEGAAEWVDQPLPAGPIHEAWPRSYTRGRGFQGKARVGVITADVAFWFDTPTATTPDGQVLPSVSPPTFRTLLLPVEVPFALDHVPSSAELAGLARSASIPEVTASLTPAPRRCGCQSGPDPIGPVALLLLFAHRRRSKR